MANPRDIVESQEKKKIGEPQRYNRDRRRRMVNHRDIAWLVEEEEEEEDKKKKKKKKKTRRRRRRQEKEEEEG